MSRPAADRSGAAKSQTEWSIALRRWLTLNGRQSRRPAPIKHRLAVLREVIKEESQPPA